MRAEGVPLSEFAYEALTSVAEKTGHWCDLTLTLTLVYFLFFTHS